MSVCRERKSAAAYGIFGSLLFLYSTAHAAAIDCIERGGLAVCTQAEPTRYKYGLCDEAGAYISRQRAACIVWSEGQWVTSPSGPSCVNTNPDALYDENLADKALQFEKFIRNECEAHVNDSGWFPPGQQTGSYQCWGGAPRYSSGVEITGYRRFDTYGKTKDSSGACVNSWSEIVFGRRDRQLICPVGYLKRTVDNKIECYKVPESCPTVGNPILPAAGGKRQIESDYVSSGDRNLRFQRTFYSYGYYRPLSANKDRPDSMVGHYWRSNFDRYVYPAPSGGSYMASMVRPDGTVRHFDLGGNEVLTQGSWRGKLTQLSSGWSYLNENNETEVYGADGKLVSISDTLGGTVTMVYSDATTLPEVAPYPGLLIRVVSSFGQELSLAYNSRGYVKSLTAPDGQTTAYTYDLNDNITQRVFSDTDGNAQTRVYHYEDTRFPRLLTGITNEGGQRYATYAYDSSGRAVLTEHNGGADRNSLTYRVSGGVYETDVTDALGTVRTYSYKNIGGVLRITGMSHNCASCGGSSSKTYDSNGFVASSTDFNGNVTTYIHDAFGREVSRTEAVGTPQERTITTEWHPDFRLPAKITTPDKITEFNYDASGQLMSNTESDRTTTP